MKIKLKLNFCLWILLAFTACKSTSKIHKENHVPIEDTGFYEIYSKKLGYELSGSEEKNFIKTVDEWLGVPYKYGGCEKDGTDCSCFVSCFYKNVYGITIPRRSEDMKQQSITIEKEALQQGDLLFFKITGEKISHVGIYISKGYFVHATTSKGVIINNLNENYYKKYYLTAGRVNR